MSSHIILLYVKWLHFPSPAHRFSMFSLTFALSQTNYFYLCSWCIQNVYSMAITVFLLIGILYVCHAFSQLLDFVFEIVRSSEENLKHFHMQMKKFFYNLVSSFAALYFLTVWFSLQLFDFKAFFPSESFDLISRLKFAFRPISEGCICNVDFNTSSVFYIEHKANGTNY